MNNSHPNNTPAEAPAPSCRIFNLARVEARIRAAVYACDLRTANWLRHVTLPIVSGEARHFHN